MLVLAVSFGLSVTWTVVAAAQDRVPSLEEKETARGLFRRGDELFQAGDFKGAYDAFKGADDIMGLPTTGLELARTQLKLLKLVEARDTLLRVVRSPVQSGEADVHAAARAEAEELAAATASRIPMLKLEIRGVADPSTVAVQLDGKPIAAAAIAHGVKVNPGRHGVRAEASGYGTRERQIDVDESQERIVTLTVRQVSQGVGRQRVTDDDVLQSTHDSAVHTVAWISFGVAGGGLAAGAIAGAITLAKESDLAEACPGGSCPRQELSALESARTTAMVSTASFVAAGVGLGLGVTALIIAEANAQPASARLVLGPGGVRLDGAF